MAKGGVVAIGCGAVVLLSVLVLVATGVMLFIASAPPDGQEFEPEISSPQVTFPDGQPDIEAPAPESESEAGRTKDCSGRDECDGPIVVALQQGGRLND